MRRIFIVLTFILGLIQINSQNKLKVGLDLGYTRTAMHANLSGLIDSRYQSHYGFGVNGSVEYLIWQSIFMSSGISYLQKNYRFERTGSFSGWYTNYNNSFLNVPLLVGGYILKTDKDERGVSLKVAAGAYGEYWLRMKRQGRYMSVGGIPVDGVWGYEDVSDVYDFKTNENQLTRWAFGLQAQVQFGYQYKDYGFFVAYNYQYGLTDINKSNDNKNLKMSPRMDMLSLGVTYDIK